VPRRLTLARAVSSAVLVATLLAGCSGGASPAPSGPTALAPGTYTSVVFKPALAYTLPAGWWNPPDSALFFALEPAQADTVISIDLFRDPLPASQDPTCPTSAQRGVGASSIELVSWVRGLPGLTVSSPRLVTVGGLRGTELDVAIGTGWKASCPFANGLPTVPLFVGWDGHLHWDIAGSERLRLDLLDVPGGGTVVVDQDTFDGTLWDQLLAVAAPIVQSFRFATP
jgi:hypothetical protein